jgi:radical SAM protein with 4Fe4S-binding SPASM domain
MRRKPIQAQTPLLVKQAAMILLYAWLTRWRPHAFLRWAGQLNNVLHAGTGVRQICCFGVNPHVVWEMTSRCNLTCIHCHASCGESSPDELTTIEGRAVIDRIAASGIRTFVFTGGEPLLRDDLFELIAHARSRRLKVFLATNGTLITEEVASRLRHYKVGVVIGLDGMSPATHDAIRGINGAYNAVMTGIANSVAEGLYLHLNIVASRRNREEIERIIEYGDRMGVYSYFIYLFMPVGRGELVRDDALDSRERADLLKLILQKQRETSAILIPVGLPEYWAYALHERGIRHGGLIRLAGYLLGGCLAGKGMVYIKPNGDVWPCPFLPISAGNMRYDPLHRIFDRLAASGFERGQVDRDCTRCAYTPVCGGCKSRMMIGTLHKSEMDGSIAKCTNNQYLSKYA